MLTSGTAVTGAPRAAYAAKSAPTNATPTAGAAGTHGSAKAGAPSTNVVESKKTPELKASHSSEPKKAVSTPSAATGSPGKVTKSQPRAPTEQANIFALSTPVAGGISPTSGGSIGGTVVTITGTGLSDVDTVTFDTAPGIAGTSLVFVSDSQIRVTTPPMSAGAVDVNVYVGGVLSTPSTLAAAFTYVASPTVTLAMPNSGNVSGGTVVGLTGTGLAGVTTVTFGGTPVTSLAFVDPSHLTVTTPAHAAGPVDVVVTTLSGGPSATGLAQFIYMATAAPAVSGGVAPSSGSTGGLTVVTITGTGFAGATGVTFGGTAGTITANTGTTLTVTTPAHAAGLVDVVVTTPAGVSVTGAPAVFNYLVSPVVSAVNPLSGGTNCCTMVTITGSGLGDVIGVNFGGSPGFSLVFVSPTQLTVMAPPHAAGIVDVVAITTSGGQSPISPLAKFTYMQSPAITSVTASGVTPGTGGTNGGTYVVIGGTNFGGVTGVTIGGVPATSLSFTNDNTVTVRSPVRANPGTVNVVLTTLSGGPSPIVGPAQQFTYMSSPVVTLIAPAAGTVVGGTPVTITGVNFTGATGVTFNNVAGTSFAVNSPTSISVTTPSGSAGIVDVVVSVAGVGTSLTGAQARYTYIAVPAVSTVVPNTGSSNGGTPVTITGTNFTGATSVTFGGTAGTITGTTTNTTITVTAPAHPAGIVDVLVTTPGGTYTSVGAFTYVAAPVVTFVTPSSGPAIGGTLVTITVSNINSAAVVTFGGTPATIFGTPSGSTITVTTPAHAAGMVDVVVTTLLGGASAIGMLAQFTYQAPAVTLVAPNTGSTNGGRLVTLTGTNFAGATGVAFGGTTGTITGTTTNTTITVTAPAHPAGIVDVLVTTPLGTSAVDVLAKFTYLAAPVVTVVAPATGSAVGGTAVTITGTDFTGATGVTFGGAAGTAFTAVNGTTVTVTTPAGTAGLADVVVTTLLGGTSATGLLAKFTYVAAPAVTLVAPAGGPLAGGTAVTITGTGFTGATGVTFGGTAGTAFTAVNGTTVTVTTPVGTAGAADVVVSTPLGGNSATGVLAKFTYMAAPAVTLVAPADGPLAGGTAVTITGTGFTGATGVTFGGTAGTAFTAVNGTSVTVTTPAGTAGVADVVVSTPGGNSPTDQLAKFTYMAAPAVTLVAPADGPLAGGTAVTITGTGFTGATGVTFGGTAGTAFTATSDTTVTVTTPAGTAGAADVVVSTPGGNSPTGVLAKFTYMAAPAVTLVAPADGPLAGGTAVTITGAGFTGATGVTFGGTAGTAFTADSDTSVTVTTPAGTAGAADVVVNTPGGNSPTDPLAKFTYVAAPAVTLVAPASGPTNGGTAVTITGTGFTGATGVTFGGVAGTAFTATSDTNITVTAPAGVPAVVDVVVTTPFGGPSATDPLAKFTYMAPPATMNGPIVRNSDGLLQMFAKSGDGNLWTSVQAVNGVWGVWTSLGGLIYSEPTAIQNASGNLDVFVIGVDHSIWHRVQTSSGFTAWARVSGVKYISTIVVAKNEDGRIQLFGRGNDHTLYYSVQTSTSDLTLWSSWTTLGGPVFSDPTVATWQDGRLEVFVVGMDGKIWHRVQSGPNASTGWLAWEHVAALAPSQTGL
jgi:hypothetical protein